MASALANEVVDTGEMDPDSPSQRKKPRLAQEERLSKPSPKPDHIITSLPFMSATTACRKRRDRDHRLKLLDMLLRDEMDYESAELAATQTSDMAELHRDLLLGDDLSLSASVVSIILEKCINEQGTKRIAMFWRVLSGLLDDASLHPYRARPYFALTAEIMRRNFVREGLSGELCQTFAKLINRVWHYDHAETVNVPIVDEVMSGLLTLANEAITIMRQTGVDYHTQTLSTDLFRRLLFPDQNHRCERRLISQENRRLVADLILLTCRDFGATTALVGSMRDTIDELDDNVIAVMDIAMERIRPLGQCSGLTNLGLTCYMNSLIQQLFANLHFRKLIFEMPINEDGDQEDADSVLSQLQKLFTDMQEHPGCVMDTSKLAQALNIATQMPDDVHSFYTLLIDGIEAAMPDSSLKSKLSKIFDGEFVSQVRGSCGHVSTRSETFRDVALTVMGNGTLHESLQEFVQGEPMVECNKYKCIKCNPDDGGLLVDAMKRTCLNQTPDHLTLCLKRFTFEATTGVDNKINDKFDFPADIDIGPFTRSALENPDAHPDPDHFTLVGVIVHYGSLAGGHYWSYVRLPSNSPCQDGTWVLIDDEMVYPVSGGVREVQHECCGGRSQNTYAIRFDSAYVLFYQRTSSIDAESSLIIAEPPALLLGNTRLPRLQLSPALATAAERTRRNLYEARHSLNRSFIQMITKTILRSLDFINWSKSSQHTSTVVSEAERQTARLAAIIMLRLVGYGNQKQDDITYLMFEIFRVCTFETRMTEIFLEALLEDAARYLEIWCDRVGGTRVYVVDCIVYALNFLRLAKSPRYFELVISLVKVHARAYMKGIWQSPFRWHVYLHLMQQVADLGVEEKSIVLEHFGLGRIIGVIFSACGDEKAREQYPRIFELARADALDLYPLFQFLNAILDTEIEWCCSEEHTSPPNSGYVVRDGRILLRAVDHVMLRTLLVESDPKLLISACRWCPGTSVIGDFAPALLFKRISISTATAEEPPRMPVDGIKHVLRMNTTDIRATLHFVISCCQIVGDHKDSSELLQYTVERLMSQSGSESFILGCLEAACLPAPLSVIRTVSLWAPNMLVHENDGFREFTRRLLEQHFFATNPNGYPQLCHVQAVLGFLKVTYIRLYNARQDENNRVDWQDTLTSVMMALHWLDWLDGLTSEATSMEAPPAIVDEMNESQTLIRTVKSQIAGFKEWVERTDSEWGSLSGDQEGEADCEMILLGDSDTESG